MTFMFFLLGLGGVIGVSIGLFLGVIPFVYSLPYLAWLGWNSGTKGIPKKHESDDLPPWEGIKFNARNATKLYRSWITKQPHGITKF